MCNGTIKYSVLVFIMEVLVRGLFCKKKLHSKFFIVLAIILFTRQ